MLFIPCSSDAKEDWGVYFAPREQIEEVDRNFASLYFERLRIPGAVGTDVYKRQGRTVGAGARTPCAGGITQNEQSAWRAVFCWRERRSAA